jgi:hypothetical protein
MVRRYMELGFKEQGSCVRMRWWGTASLVGGISMCRGVEA